MNNQTFDIKIGVLLPKSSLYPGMGLDIRDGLKGALALGQQCNYKLIFENIGNGSSDAIIYDKAEKLLLQEEVTAVVAYLDHAAAVKLGRLFQECKRLLLVLDPGANPPLSWDGGNPYMFTFSLQAALNSYLTGVTAVRNGAQRTFFSTSFYEGGYLHCNAYQEGLQGEGGSVLYHSIVPLRITDFNVAQLQYAINELQPDTVLAQFSAEAGAFFLDKYKESGLPGKARLYLSSFMLEESWINNISYPFDGMTGCVSWCSKIENEDNALFIETMKSNYDKEANVFSLLGWEAGLLIVQLMRQHALSDKKNISKTIIDFHPLQMKSPRGLLSLHKPSNVFFGPAYLVEIKKQETTGNCELEIREELTYDPNSFIKNIPEDSFSKWNNTYLCI